MSQDAHALSQGPQTSGPSRQDSGAQSLEMAKPSTRASDKWEPSVPPSLGTPGPDYTPCGPWPPFLQCGAPSDPLPHTGSWPHVPRSSGFHICGFVQRERPRAGELVAGGCLEVGPISHFWQMRYFLHSPVQGLAARTLQILGSGGHSQGNMSCQLFISDQWALPAHGPLHRFWPLCPLGHQEQSGAQWESWGSRESASAEVLSVPLRVTYS